MRIENSVLKEYLDRTKIKWHETGENCIIKKTVICSFGQIFSEQKQLGRDVAHLINKKYVRIFFGELEEKTALGEIKINGRIILKRMLTEWKDVDWNHAPQGWYQWGTVVNIVQE